ncbi:MAG: hypothetical protein J2P39_01900 [Candidatus Dormibacteraeota bacterium]|nr:hypothetical protein [Candidatus Dormibacteraeota bacterium]
MPARSRYVALATAPGVLRVALPSVLARLPLGMTTLAVLLAVQRATGSFGAAGTVTGTCGERFGDPGGPDPVDPTTTARSALVRS